MEPVTITMWIEGGVCHGVDDLPPNVTLVVNDSDLDGVDDDDESLVEIDGEVYYQTVYKGA